MTFWNIFLWFLRENHQKVCLLSTTQTLSNSSRQQIDNTFLIFPRKQTLTIYANCVLKLWCSMWIVSFAWTVKVCLLEKKKEIYFKMLSAETVTPHAKHQGLNWM